MAYKEAQFIYEESSYTPTVSAQSSSPTVTYTTQDGYYVKVGDLCYFFVDITINTISGGSGGFTVSIPFTASSTAADAIGSVSLKEITLPASTSNVVLNISNSDTSAKLYSNIDNSGFIKLDVSDFGNGDIIRASGVYHI